MKLHEMMDRTPLPGQEAGASDDRTYLAYMALHRPEHFQGLVNFLTRNGWDVQLCLNAVNLGADMLGLQVLQHGVPDDLGEVYGVRPKLYLPKGYKPQKPSF